MRKRLRKKLRRAEFTEYGFAVQYRVQAGLATSAVDDLLDRFILEAIETNDLSCGGGGGPAEWDFFVCANGRRSATDVHRRRVDDWLRSQKEIVARRIGTLQDAWNGRDELSESGEWKAAQQPDAADGASRHGCWHGRQWGRVRIRAPAPQLIRVLSGQRRGSDREFTG